MKPTALVFALAVLLAVGSAGWPTQSAAQGTEFRLADYGTPRGARAEGLRWFDQELRRRSAGQFGLRISWGGALLKGRQMVSGVAEGRAELGVVAAALAPGALPLYEAGDLPFPHGDPWVGLRAMYLLATTMEPVRAEFEQRKLVYLTNFTSGALEIASTTPIRGPGDLRGLRLRAAGQYQAVFSDLGATVVAMAQGEVYQGLANGEIDATQNLASIIRARRQYEVAPYVTELNFGQHLAIALVMNRDRWNELGPGGQRLLREVGREFIDVHARDVVEGRERDLDAMAHGLGEQPVTVLRAQPDLRLGLISRGRETIEAWSDLRAGQGLPAERVVERISQLIREATAERDSRGYPWQR